MGTFVGRESEMALAGRLIEGAASGEGAVLFVTGEPGIGKSRFAEEVSRSAEDRGLRVLWGRCWEVGGAPAFWPWSQALQEVDEGLLDLLDDAPDDDARGRRLLFFDRVARRLQAAAKEQPILLVLDDVHAADVPSLQLLLHVARERRRAPVLVLAGARATEARTHPEAAELFARLTREAHALALDRLSEEAVAEWVTAEGGTAGAEVFARSEGNPLFVEELVRLGPERIDTAPSGLSLVLDEHTARLREPVRDLVAIAAVIGREVNARWLSELAALPHDETVALLGEAVGAGVLRPPDGDRYLFLHALLRDRLYEALPPSRREELHAQLGRNLVDTMPATAAHHMLAAGAALPAAEVAEGCIAAATEQRARLAYEAARALADRALAELDGLPDALRARLLAERAAAQMASGEPDAARATCLEAFPLAEALGEPALLAQLALTYGEEFIHVQIDQDMIRLLEAAMAANDGADRGLQARLMARLAQARTPPPTEEVAAEIAELARAATDLAFETGDDATILYVQRFTINAKGFWSTQADRFQRFADGYERAKRRGNVSLLLPFAQYRACMLAELGRHTEADQALDEIDELLAQLPEGRRRAGTLTRAGVAQFRGDLALAAALNERVREGVGSTGNPALRMSWGINTVTLMTLRGDHDAGMKEAIGALTPLFSSNPAMRSMQAALVAISGDVPAAQRILEQGLAGVFALPQLITYGIAAIWAEHHPTAEDIYPRLLPFVGAYEWMWFGTSNGVTGPLSGMLASLALVLDRPGEAREHYERAVALCEQVGAWGPLAATKRWYERFNGDATAAAPSPTPAAAASPGELTLRKEGDVWLIAAPGREPLRVKHVKGFVFLERLIAAPGREVHVLELIGDDTGASDAGSVLDEEARAAYRRRVEELEEDLSEAESFGDAHRATRAREELDALADQLAKATGLGGRDRKVGSNVERARVNVQRRVKDALKRIGEHDPELRRSLERAVSTGVYCSYNPS